LLLGFPGVFVPGWPEEVVDEPLKRPEELVWETQEESWEYSSKMSIYRGQQDALARRAARIRDRVASQSCGVCTLLRGVRGIYRGQQDAWAPRAARSRIRVASRSCGVCGGKSHLRACICHKIWYCDKECQLKGWKLHKPECHRAHTHPRTSRVRYEVFLLVVGLLLVTPPTRSRCL
jgi:hypothetical protein